MTNKLKKTERMNISSTFERFRTPPAKIKPDPGDQYALSYYLKIRSRPPNIRGVIYILPRTI